MSSAEACPVPTSGTGRQLAQRGTSLWLQGDGDSARKASRPVAIEMSEAMSDIKLVFMRAEGASRFAAIRGLSTR